VADLGVFDPAQVGAGDGRVGVPELALDDQQRDPFAGDLHRVGVAELVRREPSADPGRRGSVVQGGADSG
jgi:hypothetical protein